MADPMVQNPTPGTPPPAPSAVGMAGAKKPTAVKVLQVLFVIYGLYLIFAMFVGTLLGAVVGFEESASELVVIFLFTVVPAFGFFIAVWGMQKRKKWSLWVALAVLGANLVFDIVLAGVNVLVIVITLVLAYFAWRQKSYLMAGVQKV